MAAWRYPVPFSGISRGRQVPFSQDFGYQSTERPEDYASGSPSAPTGLAIVVV
jgi:hypothetical protein